jgi:hypothetical protein
VQLRNSDTFVENGDFKAGRASLLANDAWRVNGAAGWEHVREKFEIEAVLDRRVYEELMKMGRRRR